MIIRKADITDLNAIASVYQTCFPKESLHQTWIECTYKAFPRSAYYVVESKENVVGYILWCVKNGFRPKAIVELEQIGVLPEFGGKGLGKALINKSLPMFEKLINEQGSQVGSLIVTTREGNFAEQLYIATLGVESVATIPNYGSGNEVILFKKYN